MAKRKTANIILICALLTLSLFFYGVKALAGTLSCTVRATSCLSGEAAIWRMSGTSNAHAELPSQSNYNQLVCCSGVTGLGNSCSGNYAIALKLSGTTNAHVEQNSQTNYANNICISVPSGGSVSVGYQAANCTGFDTTLGSMSGVTNAHVGDSAAYTTKICATAAVGPATTFLIGGTETGTKDTAVATITFPQAAPEATVDAPYNNIDGSGDPQVLSATVSEPVVKIKNTGGSTYNIVLEITTWTNNLVNMEYYHLANDGATNIETVTSELSNANGGARTVNTGVSIAPDAYKDLYLKLVLSLVAGKTGTSTLTVLGETP